VAIHLEPESAKQRQPDPGHSPSLLRRPEAAQSNPDAMSGRTGRRSRARMPTVDLTIL
jgi:hypothetical protein